MSVARRGESGAASASSYRRSRQRRIQSSCWVAAPTRRRWAAAARASRSCWAAAATRRRWAAAARASRSCWAAEVTRQRWAAAARAARNSATSSGPIITGAAQPLIAATTRTTAIPIANISYDNIGSPPPLAWEPNHWAYFLKFHFQSENAKPDRHSQRDDRKLKPNGSLLSRTLNTLTLCRVPDTRENLLARVRQGSRPVPHLRRPAIAPPIW